MTDVSPSSPPATDPGSSTTSLRQRIFRAAGVTLMGHGASMAIRLAGSLLLARLLAPDAFGLMAVVILFQVVLVMLSDLGTQRSLVQSHRGEDPDFYNTCWTVQLLRGLVLALVTVLIGLGLWLGQQQGWLPADRVYGDERLPPLVMVLAVLPVLQGLRGMAPVHAERRMLLGRLVMVELLSQTLTLGVMLSVAWYTRSHWALAIGAITGAVASRLLEWALFDSVPLRLRWERSALDEIAKVARWVMPASMLGLIALHSERLILAGLLDIKLFGLYSIAYLMVSAVQSVAGLLATRVVFPALSEIAREDEAGLKPAIERFQWLFDATMMTALAALVVAAPAVVDLLYDDRYRDAGPMLAVLAAGCLGMRTLVVEQCYLAQSRADFTAKTQFVRTLVLFPALFGGYAIGGALGALVGVGVAQLAGMPVAYWYKWRQGLLSWRADACLIPALLLGAGIGWGCDTLLGWLRE